MRKRHSMVALSLLCVLQTSWSSAQIIDQAAMKRWTDADLVSYHIVGDHSGRAGIDRITAEVKDRVVIDLVYSFKQSKVIGTPTFQNTKSQVTNLVGYADGAGGTCPAPVFSGEHEFFDVLSMKSGPGGAELQVRRTIPKAVWANCGLGEADSLTTSAKTIEETKYLALQPGLLLAVQAPGAGGLSVSADHKSILVKEEGWLWTFTPTIK